MPDAEDSLGGHVADAGVDRMPPDAEILPRGACGSLPTKIYPVSPYAFAVGGEALYEMHSGPFSEDQLTKITLATGKHDKVFAGSRAVMRNLAVFDEHVLGLRVFFLGALSRPGRPVAIPTSGGERRESGFGEAEQLLIDPTSLVVVGRLADRFFPIGWPSFFAGDSVRVEGAFGAAVGERGLYAIGRTDMENRAVYWLRRADLPWGADKTPFRDVNLSLPERTPITAIAGTSKGVLLALGEADTQLVSYERHGGAMMIDSGLAGPVAQMVADDRNAYFATDSGELFRIDLRGGAPQRLHTIKVEVPMQVTETGVYWVGDEGVWCVRAVFFK